MLCCQFFEVSDGLFLSSVRTTEASANLVYKLSKCLTAFSTLLPRFHVVLSIFRSVRRRVHFYRSDHRGQCQLDSKKIDVPDGLFHFIVGARHRLDFKVRGSRTMTTPAAVHTREEKAGMRVLEYHLMVVITDEVDPGTPSPPVSMLFGITFVFFPPTPRNSKPNIESEGSGE